MCSSIIAESPLFALLLRLNLSIFLSQKSALKWLNLRMISSFLVSQDTTVVGSDLKKAGLESHIAETEGSRGIRTRSPDT